MAQQGSATTPTASAVTTTTAAPRAAFVPGKYDLPLLSNDSDNYELWSKALTLTLNSCRLWDIVNSTETAPDTTTHPDDFAEWCLKDQEAQLSILLALKQVGQRCMHSTKTSSKSWNILLDWYSGGGDRRTMSLLEKVYNAKLTDTKSLQSQLDAIMFLAQQLAITGYPIDDRVLGCILAFHLPDSYATLCTVLTTQRTSSVTSKWVTDQILAEEHHHISKTGGNATAYYAKAKKGKPSEGNMSNITCSYCKKLGHKKADCQKHKKDKEDREAAKANGISASASTSNTTSNTSKSSGSGSNSNSGMSAKIAVASSSSADDTVCLFCALAIPRPAPAPTPAPPPVPAVERLHITHELVLQAQAEHGCGDLTNGWIINSSASQNMFAHCDWFQYSPLSSPINVVLSDNSSMQATGVSRISVHMSANSVSLPAVLQDVLHMPELHSNLLSVSQFARHSSEICFVGEGCSILDQCKQVVCNSDLWGNLYVMCIQTISMAETARLTVLNSFPAEGEGLPETALLAESPASRASIDTWHRHLGHLNTDDVLHMVRKGMVKGMEITRGSSPSTICEPCLKGKQARAKICKETETHADAVLGRVFSDVCGKLPTRSHQGNIYFTTWIDNKSRKVFIIRMRKKLEVTKHFKAFVARTELETGQSLKVLRSDGGGKYTAGEMQRFLQDKGIKHEMTTANTPQHNGVAECMNRTLVERVQTMLIDADLPESYWEYALQYTVLLHNISPSCSLDQATPEEA
jgi:gag-polypeptide of LTR copia-type/GAG-pre-integrase domain/Integrase core domain/C2H2 zinc-finger